MMRDLRGRRALFIHRKNRTLNTVANKGGGQFLGREFRAAILAVEFRPLMEDVKLVFAKNTARKLRSLSVLEASDRSIGFQVYGAHVSIAVME